MTLLTKEMTGPNGIAFSPDEKTLYVANSDPAKAIWMAFPVKADGTLGAGKVFDDVTSMVGEKNPGLPDGMKVDAKGNLFATGPGGVHVFAPDGTLLGRIATGEATANCAWGDDGSDPLHHRRHVHRPGEDEDERRGTLKIATWNVNGLRARQAQLEAWLAETQPDVLCLQEIKASPAQLGLLADVAGYHCYWHGDKGYSGVALLVSERDRAGVPELRRAAVRLRERAS